MEERLKKWFEENKKTIATLIVSLIMAMLAGIGLSSCSASQKISIKQQNGNDQIQETEIETNSKFERLALSFYMN